MDFDERILNGIGVLPAIVRSGTFAGAGKALIMSQPGISRAIARLEERLGVRLFERTTRSVMLTDEGRRFHEQIVPLLAGLEEAAASLVEGRASPRGRLRVHLHPFVSRLIPGPNLKTFLETHSGLQLELAIHDLAGDIVAEGFDLAIRFGHPRPSTLIERKLLDTRILTVAAPSYLKRFGRPKTPHDLERGNHRLIDFRNPETGRPFQWEFHQGRKTVPVAAPAQLMVNDVITMHEVCLAGYGIAQVMELGAEKLLAAGRLIDLFPDWPDERFPLYALYPSRRYLPAKTRVFLEFMNDLVQRLSGGEPSAVR